MASVRHLKQWQEQTISHHWVIGEMAISTNLAGGLHSAQLGIVIDLSRLRFQL
jgi:hypothetical protein